MTENDCNCDAPKVSTSQGMRCTRCGKVQEDSDSQVMNG